MCEVISFAFAVICLCIIRFISLLLERCVHVFMISQLYSSYSRHSFIYKISITMYIWYIPSTLGYSESQYCELPFHERRLVSLCVPRNARVSLIDEVYDEYEPGVASMSRQQKAEAAKERFVH